MKLQLANKAVTNMPEGNLVKHLMVEIGMRQVLVARTPSLGKTISPTQLIQMLPMDNSTLCCLALTEVLPQHSSSTSAFVQHTLYA